MNLAKDIRCGNCNRLLAKGDMESGEIEILCPRCKTHHILRAKRPSTEPHDGLQGDRHSHSSQTSQK
jgi:phage FluMu protein Com